MRVQERYVHAVTGSNLKDDIYNPATSTLAAIAVSPVKLASALYRVKYCNDATSYHNLLSQWTERIISLADKRKWPEHVSPRLISRLSLEYWLNPVCVPCKGRGNDTRINQYGGIETTCAPCGGAGIRDIEADSRIRQYVVEAVGSLNDMERIASREAMLRLQRE